MTDIDKHKCPECRTFELLLTGALSEHEEHWLAKHLDECATCRHELGQATEGAPLDLEMLDESNSEIRVKELELATRIKQKRIRAQSKSELAETFSEADGTIPLDFLEPSDNDQSLGRLGPYEITEVIGRGGMGVVLRGHDRTLSRVVAIKVLAPELAVSATARRRFLREAQAAAAVSHNHLVTIHAVDEAASPPYLVMEYVHGRSLQQRIDEEGPLELNEIVRIGIQVAVHSVKSALPDFGESIFTMAWTSNNSSRTRPPGRSVWSS